MNLNQIKLLLALNENQCNLSKAAESLFIVQSAASKQLQLLETELGIQIFERKGKRLSSLTSAGEAIMAEAKKICIAYHNIQGIAKALTQPNEGTLRIATTHTQAKYVLPDILLAFKEQYPDVAIHIEQASPKELVEKLHQDKADLAICTEKIAESPGLVTQHFQMWHHILLLPADHPLNQEADKLTLEKISHYPILTYIHGFSGSSKIKNAFFQEGIEMDIGIAAADTDIIKTYVRLGFGVGIIAETAYDPDMDSDLIAYSLEDLIPASETKVAHLKNRFLPPYTERFIESLIERLNSESD